MSKIVMGYWDCKYCETSKIEGTLRECPNCGHPRDENTKFYMDKNNIQYLTPEQSKEKGKGADWLCPYCNSLNSTLSSTCTSCGSSKQESNKDYFTMQQPDDDNKTYEATPELNNIHNNPDIDKTPKTFGFKKESILTLLSIPISLIIIGLFIWLLIPKSANILVKDFSWTSTIKIESYETVEESDWTLPTGARLQYTSEEIHHYDTVLDHYETKTRTYNEQVLDGYDISYTYSDNGDGTFTEHEVKTPIYRTETRTETYEEPVYIQVPVYETRYYYEIDKWVYKRSIVESENNKQPYYGDVNLNPNERESSRFINYYVICDIKDKTKTLSCSETIWNELQLNQQYSVKISMNSIIEIKKE